MYHHTNWEALWVYIQLPYGCMEVYGVYGGEHDFLSTHTPNCETLWVYVHACEHDVNYHSLFGCTIVTKSV